MCNQMAYILHCSFSQSKVYIIQRSIFIIFYFILSAFFHFFIFHFFHHHFFLHILFHLHPPLSPLQSPHCCLWGKIENGDAEKYVNYGEILHAVFITPVFSVTKSWLHLWTSMVTYTLVTQPVKLW